MLCLICTYFPSALVFLFLSITVTLGKETPREDKDLKDDYWFHFVTRPDIQVPKYEVHIYDEDKLAPGYWFIAPYENINKLKRGKPWEGPYIYDGHGELIWAGTPAMDYYMVNDFKVQRWNGTDMITGIMFRDNAAFFLNDRYEQVKSVSWTSEWEYANMHEFHLVDDSTRALTITRNRKTNLTLEESRTVGYEGNCMVKADGFMEVDITVEPPKVLFEWIGIDHIPLKESLHKINRQDKDHMNEVCESDWDIHHFNSVDKFADGDYLLSSKVLDTIFKISHVDGSIVWRLGGQPPVPTSFKKLKDSVRFGDQHIPRIINETETHLTLSMFANTSPRKTHGQIIRLNYETGETERLQEARTLPDRQYTVNSRGSSQLLPNGNMFTCWAEWSRVSEHDADGKLLMFSHLKWDYDNKHGNKIPTYRGFKFPWVGHPTQPPDVYSAAFKSGAENFVTRVFVSWNGATEVKRWRFYESNEDGSTLVEIDDSKWKGFETHTRFERYVQYVVVEARDEDDEAIGRSNIIKTIPPVEGAPIALDQAANVLSCNISNANDKNEFDTDYDYDGDTTNHPVYSYSGPDEPWNVNSIDPTSALVGFTTCATMWIVMTLWRRRSLRRRTGPKYQPLASKETDVLFTDRLEDDMDANDVELKER